MKRAPGHDIQQSNDNKRNRKWLGIVWPSLYLYTDSVGLETDVLLPFQVRHSWLDIHIAAYECKSAYDISDRKKHYICS